MRSNNVMTKEQFNEMVQPALTVLEAQAEALQDLINAVKRGSDVSFVAIDAAKKVTDGSAEAREAAVSLRANLRRRAMARM